MQKLNSIVTDSVDFYKGNSPTDLVSKYGSPLYVYSEDILLKRCMEMKNLVSYKNFKVNYSAKANSSLAVLQVVRKAGLCVDAMSVGEIQTELLAGFKPEDILFISNNVSKEEMLFAIEKKILISVDSLSQLEMYGKLNEGGEIAIRINPGVGAGHHDKVVTGGKKTKFGINIEYLDKAIEIAEKYKVKIVGINQHIGSLFMEGGAYVDGVKSMLSVAKKFENLKFVDLGGGFGIPYKKQEGEKRLDIKELGEKVSELIEQFVKEYGHEITFKIEPGRYIVAECGVLLGEVYAIKNNGDDKYIGTDLGFNVLARPVMYDAYHEIEVYRESGEVSRKEESVIVTGNICESGDIIAKNRVLPEIFEGDILGVLDAGAYGHVMSSNYNCRLKTAEVMIRANGEAVLVRKRDTFDDIIRNQIAIEV